MLYPRGERDTTQRIIHHRASGFTHPHKAQQQQQAGREWQGSTQATQARTQETQFWQFFQPNQTNQTNQIKTSVRERRM